MNSTPMPSLLGVGEHEFSVQILIFAQYLEKNLEGEIDPHPTTIPMRLGIGTQFFCADMGILFKF